ncbi:hypothetical protein NQZ68_019482 [Dissostichus eleginoides]|nr:hypothetical protein NQZ68_019482 [Dissostichus eleginoides]
MGESFIQSNPSPVSSATQLTIRQKPSSSLVLPQSPSSSLVLQPSSSLALVLVLQPSSSLVLHPSSCLVLLQSPSSSPALQPSSNLVLILQPSSSLVLQPSSSLVLALQPSISLVLILQPSSSLVLVLQPSSCLVLILQPSSSLVLVLQPSSSLVLVLLPSSSLVLQPSSSLVLQPSSSLQQPGPPSDQHQQPGPHPVAQQQPDRRPASKDLPLPEDQQPSTPEDDSPSLSGEGRLTIDSDVESDYSSESEIEDEKYYESVSESPGSDSSPVSLTAGQRVSMPLYSPPENIETDCVKTLLGTIPPYNIQDFDFLLGEIRKDEVIQAVKELNVGKSPGPDGLPTDKGGKGLGKGGAKRHRKVLRDNIQGITKPAIRRLARHGGVKRISGLIYEETRGVLKVFLENVIREAVTYTEHAKRKTVTAMDVVYALKRQGRTLYGFGG